MKNIGQWKNILIIAAMAVMLAVILIISGKNTETVTPASSYEIRYTDGFTIYTDNPQNVHFTDGIYTISAAGTYELKGDLNGRIVVSAGKDDYVELVLNGVSVTSDNGCAITAEGADTVEIRAQSGTVNKIIHTQANLVEEGTSAEKGKAALHANSNLELTGYGELNICGDYNNGIRVKKNLVIKNITLNVTAKKHAVKVDETITVKSGNIQLEACSGDGMKTVKSGISKKGNQHGLIAIEGGTLTIRAEDDGIHSASELTINDGDVSVLDSYEGIEGHSVNINGGNIFVYATDDAVNGTNFGSGINDANVTVNGGYLEAAVPSGDTDAMDVNGSFIQNGGLVLLRGGAPEGNTRGSIDIEEKVIYNGGTLIAVGGICNVPEDKALIYIEEGTSLPKGGYTLTDGNGEVIASFTLPQAYSSFWICSDSFTSGGKYSLLRDVDVVSSWTIER